jgi:hypothetical protein
MTMRPKTNAPDPITHGADGYPICPDHPTETWASDGVGGKHRGCLHPGCVWRWSEGKSAEQQKPDKWAPWITYAAIDQGIMPELPIFAPPCADCRFWAPRREYQSGKMIGIICCHGEFERDFSCFEDAELARGEP